MIADTVSTIDFGQLLTCTCLALISTLALLIASFVWRLPAWETDSSCQHVQMQRLALFDRDAEDTTGFGDQVKRTLIDVIIQQKRR